MKLATSSKSTAKSNMPSTRRCIRGSRDFADRAACNRFLQNLVKHRNLRRQERWLEEREALRPLPTATGMRRA